MIESLIHLLSKFPIPDWAKRYPDKYQHAALNLLFAVFGMVILHFLKLDTKTSTGILLFAATIINAGKEWYDSKHPDKHTADIYDFLAGQAGCALGILLFLFLQVIYGR